MDLIWPKYCSSTWWSKCVFALWTVKFTSQLSHNIFHCCVTVVAQYTKCSRRNSCFCFHYIIVVPCELSCYVPPKGQTCPTFCERRRQSQCFQSTLTAVSQKITQRLNAVVRLAAAHLCLDDVPGIPQANVIFGVVEHQAVLQVLLGVLPHLRTKETDTLGSPP